MRMVQKQMLIFYPNKKLDIVTKMKLLSRMVEKQYQKIAIALKNGDLSLTSEDMLLSEAASSISHSGAVVTKGLD